MTLAQSYDVDTSIRLSNAVGDAVAQLTKPRLVHTDIRNDTGGIEHIHTEEHPALIDLLQRNDALQSGGGRGGAPPPRTPIDPEAPRTPPETRPQVGRWPRQSPAPPTRAQKGETPLGHRHYDNAVT